MGAVKQACDRLAEVGFVALAPDFYRGKTTASIEEAEALGAELDRNVKRWRGDIVGALQFLRQHGATRQTVAARSALSLSHWEAPTCWICRSIWPRRSPPS